MSDFRTLAYTQLASDTASIVFGGLDVTPYSVLEIHAELKTDRASNTWDAFTLTPSSGIGVTSGDGGTANTAVAYSSGNSYPGAIWANALGNAQNAIVGICAGNSMSGLADRSGMPARILVFNPVKELKSTERDITVYAESTGVYGSTIGESAYDQDVYRTVNNWPGRTDASITSLTFASYYSANFLTGSWVAIYGYYGGD